jgi:hypothetical protein
MDQEYFEHLLHFIILYSLFLFDIRPVRMEGLEPPCLAAIDPKSIASTNFATSARLDLKLLINRSFCYIISNILVLNLEL